MLKSLDDLKEAPYNPRSISKEALKGLQYSLEMFGDISGIVWNKRTGHLVCGHQRVRALKEKYGDDVSIVGDDQVGHRIITPAGDFEVRVVDWTEDIEMAANVAANAPTIAGVFTADLEGIIEQIEQSMPDISDALMFKDIEWPDSEDIEKDAKDSKNDTIPAMELQPYESYDYVLILCRTTLDWEWLCEKLKIARVNASPIAGKKKIGLGRAIPVERLMEIMGEKRDGGSVHPLRGEVPE